MGHLSSPSPPLSVTDAPTLHCVELSECTCCASLLCEALVAGKDYWRRTFYEPDVLVADDGAALVTRVSAADNATVQTEMTLNPRSQFDQGGIFVRIDSEHWVKAGIEFVDGSPRLSCVVTNGFSDWSTQRWVVPPLVSSATPSVGWNTSARPRVNWRACWHQRLLDDALLPRCCASAWLEPLAWMWK
jgi:hypothetical protein